MVSEKRAFHGSQRIALPRGGGYAPKCLVNQKDAVFRTRLSALLLLATSESKVGALVSRAGVYDERTLRA